ncbi:sensor domain-containing diguanylate cyclase [Hansschlegelia zhihuaiae]|uniref:diguanylate cyclase n=1 Tax=Hansschlegelia zhihuaiae TaxID=405005 RepID=A0A4Q0MLZ6_9HYPH|nr:GGDEF domain-containing protein [Hansschlegelia zhihuaiae]RXF74089.1 GGDEF domain-containing protein [Hansschlegelia zhihuaiae]
MTRTPDLGPLVAVRHPVAIVAFADTTRIALNPAAARLFGAPFHAGADKALDALIGSAAADKLEAFLRELPRHGVGASIRLFCEAPAGERSVFVDVERMPGSPGAFLLTLQPQNESSLGVHALAQAQATLNALPVGIELYDSNFNALFYNKKSDELFDYSERAVAHHDDWWELAFPDHARRVAAREEWVRITGEAARDPGRAHMAEWEVMCRDGEARTIQFYYRRADQGFSLVLWDVTGQRRLERELREIAGTDSLTGVANRRSFFERGRALLAEDARAEELTVLMLDIDHFKAVNDGFGHAFGDEVLATVARRAGSVLRKNDFMARMGGEEFAVLLPGTGSRQAIAIAERLRRAVVHQPVTAEGASLAVTVSVGSASRLPGETEIDPMIARADEALYAAKAEGRNRVVAAETMLSRPSRSRRAPDDDPVAS